jgi:hypothetical protein
MVWGFNPRYTLGPRFLLLPMEDSMYLLFFLLLTITFYERPLKRAHGDLPPVTPGRVPA